MKRFTLIILVLLINCDGRDSNNSGLFLKVCSIVGELEEKIIDKAEIFENSDWEQGKFWWFVFGKKNKPVLTEVVVIEGKIDVIQIFSEFSMKEELENFEKEFTKFLKSSEYQNSCDSIHPSFTILEKQNRIFWGFESDRSKRFLDNMAECVNDDEC